jgi:hypothetical protein
MYYDTHKSKCLLASRAMIDGILTFVRSHNSLSGGGDRQSQHIKAAGLSCIEPLANQRRSGATTLPTKYQAYRMARCQPAMSASPWQDAARMLTPFNQAEEPPDFLAPFLDGSVP